MVHKNRLVEDDLQKIILDHLENDNGYIVRDQKEYNSVYAMDKEMLFKFLYDTQSKEMGKLEKTYKDRTEETVLNHINKEINKEKRSLIDVLKNGVEFDSGVSLKLMYRKPANSYNTQLMDLYNKNIFSVMEEVYHKKDERIDLVIFLNGLAIITFELKANTSGQSYEDAIRQYKTERDHKTRLFKFKAGSLVNFAMDFKEVYMTTELKGKSSYFLPFNKGSEDGGKGNPNNEEGFNVSYMWEDILTKDTLLYIIDKFLFIDRKKQKGKKKDKEILIFPRYHQLTALRKLTEDITENKSSLNYLIQHSAGSGKTYTIAWLAHRLASLHDKDDKIIYDNIVIITDRLVVDKQLQHAIMEIDHKQGLVKTLDDTCSSQDLADALNGNTKIVVSTIQKFLYIMDSVKNLKGKKFAVIIDEAHSSTSGRNMEAVRHTLSSEEVVEYSTEDLIQYELNRHGKLSNISMIAFTATPKPTTLQLFGTMNELGEKEAFDLYSMRQAIEEGFILDVLQNYVTYKTYCELDKATLEDPLVKTRLGKREISKFIELHETNINQKVEIIVEHFKNNIMRHLGGNAKAMVVTSSRAGAVKYKIAFEKYIENKGYSNIKALVAFSGQVDLKDDKTKYTETGMNGFNENDIARQFDTEEYKVLLVANKYQTGFDQPKLQAMYIDKKLKGVNAVQTISRLNRIFPPYDKTTFVLDFKNEYDDIVKAFAPYYTSTLLAETVTPSSIRDIDVKISHHDFLSYDDIQTFNELIYKQDIKYKDKAKMESLLDKALKKIQKNDKKTIQEVQKLLQGFIRFYQFLTQASCFEDMDLHKKYNFITYLIKELDVTNNGNGFDLSDKITANKFNQKLTAEILETEITSETLIKLPTTDVLTLEEEQEKRLSELVEEINVSYGKRFGNKSLGNQLAPIHGIMFDTEELKISAKNNTIEDFKLAYDTYIDTSLIKGFEENQELFTILLNDDRYKNEIMGLYVKSMYEKLREK